MLTESNFKANLITARRNAGAAMHLDNYDGSDAATRALPFDVLRVFDQVLAGIIMQHPDSFDPQRVESAQKILGHEQSSLDDASFSVKDFAGETLGNAPAVLGGFTNKLLAALTIGAVIYFLILAAMNRPSKS